MPTFSSSIGNAVSYRPSKNFVFPSIALCVNDRRMPNSADFNNLTEMTELARSYTLEPILSIRDFGTMGPEVNLVEQNKTVIGDLFDGWMLIPGRMFPPLYCINYTPPKESGMGLVNKVRGAIDLLRGE